MVNDQREVDVLLEKLKAIFATAEPSVDGLRAGESEIVAALTEAQEKFTALCSTHGERTMESLARGDERGRLALRKQLEEASARVRELETARASIRQRIADKIEADQAAALAARWKRTRELCAQREKAAADLQAAAKAAAEAWKEIQTLTEKIGGVLPAPRASRVFNAWYEGTTSTFDAQLFALSGGGIGDERAFPSTRYSTKAAYLAAELDVVGVVQKQHRQILGPEGVGRSILLPEAA